MMEADILQALRSRLVVFAQSKSLPIAFTNVEFTAPVDGRYLRESFLPNGTVRDQIADEDSSFWRGLYQVDLFGPRSEGATALVEIAAALSSHFADPDRLRHGGAAVRITRYPDASPLMIDGSWSMVPVTVTWEAIAEPEVRAA